jgi:hypothetical protein
MSLLPEKVTSEKCNCSFKKVQLQVQLYFFTKKVQLMHIFLG